MRLRVFMEIAVSFEVVGRYKRGRLPTNFHYNPMQQRSIPPEGNVAPEERKRPLSLLH